VDSMADASPRRLARIAGGLYLINILGGAFAITVVPAMLVVSGDLASVDYTIHTVFFGLDILVFAYLVLNSKFLPRTIGVLLAIDGLAYLCYSFTDILAPDTAAHLVPWIQLPALIGEGSLCLWLLVIGINLEQWNQQMSTATELQPT
jgi:Domain of unknown function (DUF4386)